MLRGLVGIVVGLLTAAVFFQASTALLVLATDGNPLGAESRSRYLRGACRVPRGWYRSRRHRRMGDGANHGPAHGVAAVAARHRARRHRLCGIHRADVTLAVVVGRDPDRARASVRVGGRARHWIRRSGWVELNGRHRDLPPLKSGLRNIIDLYRLGELV